MGDPFRVTIALASGVSLNHPWLHLDSLLRHLVDERTYRRDARLGWTPEMREGQSRLQRMRAAGTDKYIAALDRRRIADDWIGCASVSEFAPDVPFETLRYFKRFEHDGFPLGNRTKVNMASGHYRTWMMRTVYVPCETVTFYGVGLMGQVTDLLGDLTHLGNDGRIGWGQVHDVRVERWPHDWSLLRDGKATRPIPLRMLKAWDDEAWLTWHAPYWDRTKVERCAPPGAAVELR
jgi:hypothetical protein